MRILGFTEQLRVIAKSLQKPLLYISFVFNEDWNEIIKAAPYLELHNVEHVHIFLEGGGLLVCENEEEMTKLFNLTVGDDGPTSLNPYDGSVRVYALTINADGEFCSENT